MLNVHIDKFFICFKFYFSINIFISFFSVSYFCSFLFPLRILPLVVSSLSFSYVILIVIHFHPSFTALLLICFTIFISSFPSFSIIILSRSKTTYFLTFILFFSFPIHSFISFSVSSFYFLSYSFLF